MLTFGIPAHQGGRGPTPEFAAWAGLDAARFDLPMSHGVDTRDRAWGVQSTAQELFAEAVGAEQVLFSTNGSSMSAHVAMLTVAGPGDTLVMARNGHKSAFAGLVLTGARPVYLDPYYDEELEIALGPLAGDLARTLDQHPHATAALVFTPSYYGTSADVRALADACHARDLPLVTDDAWGSTTSSPAIRTCPRARWPRARTWRSARSTRHSAGSRRRRCCRSARTASTASDSSCASSSRSPPARPLCCCRASTAPAASSCATAPSCSTAPCAPLASCASVWPTRCPSCASWPARSSSRGPA